MTEEVGQRQVKCESVSGDSEGDGQWRPSSDWIREWKSRLPFQTIMRMLQVWMLLQNCAQYTPHIMTDFSYGKRLSIINL